ncbi:TPA: phenolic acid decarboxylase [Enterobacter cloacae]
MRSVEQFQHVQRCFCNILIDLFDSHEQIRSRLLFDILRKVIHGTILILQWNASEGWHPEKTICYQNEFIEDMRRFRDDGPAYPVWVIPEFATVTCMKKAGPANDAVIIMSPGQLPADYFDTKEGKPGGGIQQHRSPRFRDKKTAE